MTTFCRSCGREVASQYRFCPECGSRDFSTQRPSQTTSSTAPLMNATFSQAPTGSGARVVYSGFWRRFAAFFIDVLVLLIPSVLLLFICIALGFGEDSMMTNLANGILSLLYFAGMESSSYQGTVGKRAMGIRVCDMNGKQLSFANALGRYVGKILSSLLLCTGYLMIAFTSRKQGLHDIMAGTVVLYQAK